MAPAEELGPQGGLWFTFYVPRHDRHALIIRELGDRSRQCIGKILLVEVLLLLKPAAVIFTDESATVAR
jgi:hypothetical protein